MRIYGASPEVSMVLLMNIPRPFDTNTSGESRVNLAALMVISFLIISLTLFYPVTPLTCHSCSGTDHLPSNAVQLVNSMNMSTLVPVQGNCKGKTGTDVCTNGLFCVKKTATFSIQSNGLSISWDGYTKGCASIREDNAGVPTSTCYDISTTNQGGYTKKIRHCYCQTDFCNSSVSLFFNSVYIIFVMYFIK